MRCGPGMTHPMTDDLAAFVTELGRQEVAETTIRAYRADMGAWSGSMW